MPALLVLLTRHRYALVLAGFSLGALCAVVVHAAMADLRRADTRQAAMAMEIAEFDAAMGFGGFIHHFKDYVLRGGDYYREQAVAEHGRAVAALIRLRDLAGEDEPLDIEPVLSALRTYREYLDIASQGVAAGASPRAVDLTVRIDDAGAVLAFRRVVASIQQRLAERRALLLAEERVLLVSGAAFGLAAILLTMIVLNRAAESVGLRDATDP